MLTILESIPDRLLEIEAKDLYQLLPGPTLIHLAGHHPQPLFVSVLLHGNEDTGFKAMQMLLKSYQHKSLPRALSIFIGNVEAARHDVRYMPSQPDFNRVWPGSEMPLTPEHKIMADVVDIMQQRNLFISLDIHNNTGMNPHYACINRIDDAFLNIAHLFSRTIVYFIRPKGVQTLAFADICPAVTVECGQIGQVHGVEHAKTFIDACLHLTDIPNFHAPKQDLDVFHTVAAIKVPQDVDFDFGDQAADLVLVDGVEYLNFRELPANSLLGHIQPGSNVRLEAWNEQGKEVGQRFFAQVDNELRLQVPVMPAMLTNNKQAVRQDCLCYFMERYPLT